MICHLPGLAGLADRVHTGGVTRTRLMAVLIGAAVVVVVALVGAFIQAAGNPGRPGDPAVYSRIEASASCDDVQGEFDAADARRKAALNTSDNELAETNLAYMNAAVERMRALNCT